MTDWLSVEEAAELSSYSEEQLRRLIRTQLIRAAKKGRMWWVDRQSLQAYLKASSRSSDNRRGPKSK